MVKFIAGLIIGAILMYMFLWYQAFNTLEGVMCQISTTSVENCVRNR